MFRTDTDALELTGKSGKNYTFQMCECELFKQQSL